MKKSPLLALMFVCGLGACATTTSGQRTTTSGQRTTELENDDNRAGARRGVASRPASSPAHALLLKLPDGRSAIRRTALLRLQGQGAQQFIQQVRVRPAFLHGRFNGWRVVAYRGPGTLLAGDVVTRINGRSIERPEQFMGVWEGLARAASLVVEVLRRGRPVVYRLPIIEDSVATRRAHD